MPGANTADGLNEAPLSPLSPPWTITAITSRARMAVSAISSTPRIRAPTSIPRRPTSQTSPIATNTNSHQGRSTPASWETASETCWPEQPVHADLQGVVGDHGEDARPHPESAPETES